MSSTDWRGLCEELFEALNWHKIVFETETSCVRTDETHLLDRAREALAQPEPEVVVAGLPQRPECFEFALDFPGPPEDDELRAYIEQLEGIARAALAQPETEDDVAALRAALRATAAQRRAEDDARALLAQPEPEVMGPDPFVVRHYTDNERPSIKGNGFDGLEIGEDRQEAEEFIAWINERLARWGRPAPAPAGDVGELVAALRSRNRWAQLTGVQLTRAADLLEQRQAATEDCSATAPVPVAVSERPWDREGWCDAEGRCWWFCPSSVLPNGMCPYWCLAPAESPRSWFTHCLPAHALPLPNGEVVK